MLQSGVLVNMFRAMVDNVGDIEAGILAYSELVEAERDKLPRDVYEKLLVACNDKRLSLFDIGNTIAETWTEHPRRHGGS